MTVSPTLLRIGTEGRQQCPCCAHFLPGFRGQDEVVCTFCGSVFERPYVNN